MDIEFDPAKDAANIAKHGVSLLAGVAVIGTEIATVEDISSVGEARFNAYGFAGGVAMVCTYTMRGETFRIISVRRMTKKEKRAWLW